LCIASPPIAALRVVVFSKRRVQNGLRFAPADTVRDAKHVRAIDSDRIAPDLHAVGF
jgi:hypothetical protein